MGDLPSAVAKTHQITTIKLLLLSLLQAPSFHSLDYLQVRIIVFQCSMACSLTPVQTNHLQIRTLNYLWVPFHHSPRLLVVIVQTASSGRSRQP